MESASHWEDWLLWNDLLTSLAEDREWLSERLSLAAERSDCGAGDVRGHMGNLYLPLSVAVNPALLWNLKVC